MFIFNCHMNIHDVIFIVLKCLIDHTIMMTKVLKFVHTLCSVNLIFKLFNETAF